MRHAHSLQLGSAILLGVVILVFVLAMVSVVMPWLFARFGGWTRLAQHFLAREAPNGKKFSRESIRLNSVRYNNCLTIYVSDEGLYLHMSPFLRFGHPDLLIPWRELQDPVPEEILWGKFMNFQVGRPTLARLRLSERVLQDLPAAA